MDFGETEKHSPCEDHRGQLPDHYQKHHRLYYQPRVCSKETLKRLSRTEGVRRHLRILWEIGRDRETWLGRHELPPIRYNWLDPISWVAYSPSACQQSHKCRLPPGDDAWLAPSDGMQFHYKGKGWPYDPKPVWFLWNASVGKAPRLFETEPSPCRGSDWEQRWRLPPHDRSIEWRVWPGIDSIEWSACRLDSEFEAEHDYS